MPIKISAPPIITPKSRPFPRSSQSNISPQTGTSIDENVVIFLNETNKGDNYQRLYYNVYGTKSLKNSN